MINPNSHTACKNCIFAIYEGNTQVDCKVGRIEQYRSLNSETVMEVFDNEKEFYVINNRICLYYRNKIHYCLAPYDDISEIKSIVRKAMQVKYQFIIIYKQDQDIQHLDITLSSLDKQSISPQILTVINRNLDQVSNKSILHDLEYRSHIWKVHGAINLDLSDEAYVDIVFDATKNKSYSFYITCNAGSCLPNDFIANLDHAINDELQTFHMIVDDDIEIVPKHIHEIFGGNSFDILLKNKIDSDQIKSMAELCQTIQK